MKKVLYTFAILFILFFTINHINAEELKMGDSLYINKQIEAISKSGNARTFFVGDVVGYMKESTDKEDSYDVICQNETYTISKTLLDTEPIEKDTNERGKLVAKKGTIFLVTEYPSLAATNIENAIANEAIPTGTEIELAEDYYKNDQYGIFKYNGKTVGVPNNKMSNSSSIRSRTINYDIGNGFDPGLIPSGETPSDLMNPVYRIWNTVIMIIRIAAFAGIIFAGVRYLYTSADQKADIKKSLVLLIIGMVLVFASTIVIEFVVEIFKQLKM